MKLSDFVLEELAKMVVGDNPLFPYKSSYYISKFFERCDLPFRHDGTTRPVWTKDRLAELNREPAQTNELPSENLCRVIRELFNQDDFERVNRRSAGSRIPTPPLNIEKAIDDFNKMVKRHGLVAYLDSLGYAHLRSTGTGITTESHAQQSRPLSSEEVNQRQKLIQFLDTATEDAFIEKVLVPLFQRLGFKRVSATGHMDRSLEFGKDLWMKYQLPTGHWLYFCAQVKKDKIDSNNASGARNVANVLSQVKMAIDHPIFDPDANRKVLLDHFFLISAGEITKAARTWLVEQLDSGQRRHIIFMDRNELLDHAARIHQDLHLGDDDPEPEQIIDDADIPF